MNPKRRAVMLLIVVVLAGGLAITCTLVMRGFTARVRDAHLHTIDVVVGQLLAGGQAWAAANPDACAKLEPGDTIVLDVKELVPPNVPATIEIERPDPDAPPVIAVTLTHGTIKTHRTTAPGGVASPPRSVAPPWPTGNGSEVGSAPRTTKRSRVRCADHEAK